MFRITIDVPYHMCTINNAVLLLLFSVQICFFFAFLLVALFVGFYKVQTK